MLMKVAQVAEVLQVSEDKVRDLVASGELPVTRIGRSVRVPETGLRRYIAQHTVSAPAPTTNPAA